MPRHDSVEFCWCFLALRRYYTLAGRARKTNFRGFHESLDAVVDHDGDRADGDGECGHAGQDGPDAPKAIVDDRSNDERNLDGMACVASRSRFVLIVLSFGPLQRRK